MQKTQPLFVNTLLFTALALGFGCAGGGLDASEDAGTQEAGAQDAGAQEAETPSAESHACDHAQYGPDATIAATVDATGAPTVSEGMHRYTITLPSDGANAYSGVFLLDVQEMGMWHFTPPEGVTFRLVDAAGAVSVDEEAPQACTDLVTRLVGAMLDVGTYTVELDAPSAEVVMGARSNPEI